MGTHVTTAVSASLLLLSSCAYNSPRKSSFEEDPNFISAMSSLKKCANDNISEVDDLISDASTIALSLSQRCHVEYNNVTEAVAYSMDNTAQRVMIRQRINSQETRVTTLLPFVMSYRHFILSQKTKDSGKQKNPSDGKKTKA